MRAGMVAGMGLILASSWAHGQDLGGLLERAARDVIQKSLTPEKLERALVGQVPGQASGPRVDFHTVKTLDGWTLVARRYRPARGVPRGPMPVILCHGLTYNADFWDLDPSCSLAQYLAERGFDVWAVDLRGAGLSQKWVFKLDEAPAQLIGRALNRATKGTLGSQGHATVDLKYADWDLDDHIARDVPALVRLVRRQTQAPEVAWVGHSMGGIVALAHLARHGNPGIGRLVTVGSQVTMKDGQLFLPFLQEMLLTRQRQLAGQFVPEELISQTRTSVHNLFFNVRHVSPQVYQALGTYAMDIPSLGLLKQYSILSSTGELQDAQRRFNYAKALGNVQVPILVACGASDVFAPLPIQRYLYNHVGSTDKTLLMFGRQSGFAVDSGHNDALVGLTSRQQIYPLIERWLRGERW
jgi:pimeloyl-ACP methyl ester carboxylesterase